MPQSPHRLRSDLKCVEWDVKPYYTHTDILTVLGSYVMFTQLHDLVQKTCHSIAK